MKYRKSQQDKLQNIRSNAKYTKIVQQHKMVDILYMNFKPECNIRKISKDKYIVGRQRLVHEEYESVDLDGNPVTKVKTKLKFISNGEVFEMSKTGERNKRSLRKIFVNLRYLINTNFYEDDFNQQLFITLTYAENMQDPKKLYNDFKKFFQKLQRFHKEHELSYIVIVEPQGRGAWHCHLLVKTLNQEHIFMEKEKISELWGHGFTTTQRLSPDNIGSYFIAYLSNAELDEEKIASMQIDEDDIKEKNGKKYIKGSRLKFYDDYMQIYRHSRNIKKPKLNPDSVNNATDKHNIISFQDYKEIPIDEERLLKIGKEQRYE